MEVSDRWVTEFFLRHQHNPRAYSTSLLPALKSDDCVKHKITAVLRDISSSLIRGRVDEEMLDLLENLERLLQDSIIMGTLQSAYCWTAVECTLRFMWPITASDGFFSDVLERIWKKRIGRLKERENDLVTRELLKWESDLKLAFQVPEMYQKIREINIRHNAMSHIYQLLKEQWALVGCSPLEAEARKLFFKRKDPNAVRIRGKIYEKENRNGKSTEEANDVEEHDETSLNKEDITVPRQLKDCFLELVYPPSTRQGEETNNNAVDHSFDVSHQPDRANRNGTGAGQQEVSQGTSSSSSRRVRPCLPTPEPLNVSPLKKGRSAETRQRRPTKPWTPEQVEALREGVKEYGKSWKDIKNSNPLVFSDRTLVDLKDKWRNLIGRHR